MIPCIKLLQAQLDTILHIHKHVYVLTNFTLVAFFPASHHSPIQCLHIIFGEEVVIIFPFCYALTGNSSWFTDFESLESLGIEK